MEQNKIRISLGEVQSLIKEIKEAKSDTNSKLWIQMLSQLDEISHSIVNGESHNLLSDKWRLETMVTMATEIDRCLQMIRENGTINRLMHGSSAYILNIFWETFKFCQVAGGMCSGEMEEVTENLASLFKLSYQNIKMIIDVFETFSDELFGEDMNYLRDVFVSLIRCSQVLADIDIMASVAIWKSIKKLFIQHKDLLLINHLKFSCLFDVCGITCKTLTCCFDMMDNKDGSMISKYQKVIRFFLGIILLLTKDFKEVMTDETCRQVYELIHLIQQLSLIEIRKDFESKDCSAEYESSYNTLLCVNDPLMKDFVEANGSAQCILGKLYNSHGDGKYEAIVCLLDILNVLECLSERTELVTPWMESSLCIDVMSEETPSCCCILDVFFICVERCSSSLFMQRKDFFVMDKSKCLKETSLYEIVLGKLCTFVSTLPSNYFTHLESVMLSNVLIGSKYRVLLATDLWCFISRWGKAELCLHYFLFLGKLLVRLHHGTSNDVAINNLISLLQRLFWFLEDTQHEQIISSFPITSSNMVVWKLLPWSHLNVTNKLNVSSNIVETVISLIELKQKQKNNEHQIVCGVQCMTHLLGDDGDLYENISMNTKQRLHGHVYEFWSCFKNLNEDIEINELLVVAMLSLTSILMPYLDGKYIYEVLSIINTVLQNTGSQAFQIECTHLLTNLKDMAFSSEIQSNCLTVISEMFQFLMTCEDWIVDDCSMKALQMFAQETMYSHALVTFLPQSRKKDFTSYLRKETSTNNIDDKLMEVVFQCLSRNNNEIHSKENIMIAEDEKTSLDDTIDKTERCVQELDDIMKKGPRLPSHITRIKNIISILENSCR